MKTAPIPTRIDQFQGSYRFLSNMYDAPVKLWVGINGVPYASVPPVPLELMAATEDYDSTEHAFQAGKSLNPDIREKFRIRGVSPYQAKRMGRALRKVRDDWEILEGNGRMLKVNFMRDLLVQKFAPSIPKRRLLSTFSAKLIEGNNWHDEFWGVCDGTCKEGPHEPNGLNWLGTLHMEVRSHYGLGAPLV